MYVAGLDSNGKCPLNPIRLPEGSISLNPSLVTTIFFPLKLYFKGAFSGKLFTFLISSSSFLISSGDLLDSCVVEVP